MHAMPRPSCRQRLDPAPAGAATRGRDISSSRDLAGGSARRHPAFGTVVSTGRREGDQAGLPGLEGDAVRARITPASAVTRRRERPARLYDCSEIGCDGEVTDLLKF